MNQIFNGIPAEGTLMVLSHLRPADLAAFSLASRHSHLLANDISLWACLCLRDLGVRPRNTALSKTFYRVCLQREGVPLLQIKSGKSKVLGGVVSKLRIEAEGLEGADRFEMRWMRIGELTYSYLLGGESSVVQISGNVRGFDPVFYAFNKECGGVVLCSVVDLVEEYNKKLLTDFYEF